ncbi:hypothetical protein [Pseudomonas synxantha]|uniref:hypothetical protein n=1 Tax=Pseudomonas synxantha TaxID=47883 RepID=UPI000F55E605|nr:hypothetical protein [Pseudomonas synxantha]
MKASELRMIPRIQEVIRIDSRHPTQDPGGIFENGFLPWGTNNNLLYHATGDSVTGAVRPGGPDRRRTSNFVGTSDTTGEQATQILIRDLTGGVERGAETPVNRVWVYEIQADNNFYSLVDSLDEAEESGLYEGEVLRQIRAALNAFHWHNEYAALGGVRAERIRGAVAWNRVQTPGQPVPFRWVIDPFSRIANPNFRPSPDPGTNPNTYTRMIEDTPVGRTLGKMLVCFAFWRGSRDNTVRNNPGRTISSWVRSNGICFTGVLRDEHYKDPAYIIDLNSAMYMVLEPVLDSIHDEF